MRSQGFKAGNAQIRGIREKQKTKRINWDRIVYLIIVNMLLISVAYILLTNFFIATGDGRVIVDRFNVRFPSDVHIDQMLVQKGDTVKQFDDLFMYSQSFQVKSPEEYERIQRNLRERIFENQTKINREYRHLLAVRKQIQHFRSRLAVLREEVKLNLSTPRLMFETEDRIVGLQADSALVMAEIAMLREIMQYLEGVMADDGLVPITQDPELRGGRQIYEAPVEGIIEQILKSSSELAVRSESILSIRRETKDIMIRAVFDRGDLNYLENGKQVDLKFDNGLSSLGVIKNIYSADMEDIATINRNGVMISEQLIVEIRPKEEKDMLLWEANSGISLTVKSSIF